MPRGRKATKTKKAVLNTKYDANNIVLDKTYGAWADLRRELSDSKSDLAERTELLEQFSACEDSQRAFLILDDYFERLSLSRRDFVGPDWWARMLDTTGKERLEETALLFLRAKRPLPTELMTHANFDRLAQVEEAEKDHELITHLEKWILPPKVDHLDAPRASVRALFELVPVAEGSSVVRVEMRLTLSRPRSGERFRTLGEIKDLTTRSSHERELFSSEDWEFIEWVNEIYLEEDNAQESMILKGADLLRWLAKW
ncbi:MAG: ATP-dependent helicase, partial [Verrucomicrobia bacterium]|nr:ATP-dependent helicase [Verrucomicrobiota bacterium]